MNDEGLRETLLDADVNEVVCAPDLTENVLIQSTFNHGLSEILHSLLSYNTANEFYLIDVEDYPAMVGLTFDEALHDLRNRQILLVAIKVVYRSESGRELIDKRALEVRLRAHGLTRQILTNPIFEGEERHRIRKEDPLFVLARDEHEIRKRLA